MPDFAIIQTGGKQYRVQPGQIVTIEKLDKPAGTKLSFDRVLLFTEGTTVEIGNPILTGYTVTAEVVEEFKDKKIRVSTYKSKKRQRRTLGHRQTMTRVKIDTIGLIKTKEVKEVKEVKQPKAKATAK